MHPFEAVRNSNRKISFRIELRGARTHQKLPLSRIRRSAMIRGATPEHLALIGDVLAYGGRNGSWDRSLGDGGASLDALLAKLRYAFVHGVLPQIDPRHGSAYRNADCRVRLPDRCGHAADRIRTLQGLHRSGVRAVAGRNRRGSSGEGAWTRAPLGAAGDAARKPRHAGTLRVGFGGLPSLLARSVFARLRAMPRDHERGVAAAQQNPGRRRADDQDDGHVALRTETKPR